MCKITKTSAVFSLKVSESSAILSNHASKSASRIIHSSKVRQGTTKARCLDGRILLLIAKSAILLSLLVLIDACHDICESA